MRNWNVTEHDDVVVGKLGLPDYLWGIETCGGRQGWQNGGGSFQTTYEELKPLQSRRLLPGATRFQTTYEELKLSFRRVAHGCLDWASRLPMRNWNWRYKTWAKRLDSLPDYLWGIETRIWTKEANHPGTASRLPMRNWNAWQKAQKRSCP